VEERGVPARGSPSTGSGLAALRRAQGLARGRLPVQTDASLLVWPGWAKAGGSGSPRAPAGLVYPMITVFDSLNIGFYFAFIVGVGLYFARKSKDTSDYFRGGGGASVVDHRDLGVDGGFLGLDLHRRGREDLRNRDLRARALLFQYHPAGGVAARRLLPLPPAAGHHSAGGPAAAFRAGRTATLHVVAPADHDDFRRLWLERGGRLHGGRVRAGCDGGDRHPRRARRRRLHARRIPRRRRERLRADAARGDGDGHHGCSRAGPNPRSVVSPV
jgi:hypothetical protein